MKAKNGDNYRGFWIMNVRHGYGEQDYTDETKYTGTFKENLKDGHGNQSEHEGAKVNIYEGQWRGGKPHGFGFLYDEANRDNRRLAEFADGKRKIWVNKRRKVKYNAGVYALEQSWKEMSKLQKQFIDK